MQWLRLCSPESPGGDRNAPGFYWVGHHYEIKGDVASTGGDHQRPALVKHSFMGVVEIPEVSHFFLILLNEFLYFFPLRGRLP